MSESVDTRDLESDGSRAPDPSQPVIRPWMWPVAVALIALIPVRGVFSTHEIFYWRDLMIGAYPFHGWLQNTVFSGEWPFWDPYTACGQAAISDSVRLLCFPPVLLLRLLLPTTVGFNLTVALPFPVAALGMYALLRRHVAGTSAAFGALVFALSGPVVSTGNLLNLSWATACLPWILWAVDRLVERRSGDRFAVAAALFSMQFLAVEPVMLAGTAALAGMWALVRGGWRPFALTTFAGVCGLLLGAVQVFPTLQVLSESSRPYVQDGWPLDPRRFVEMIVPYFYGDQLASAGRGEPWLALVNSGRSPFFLSVFLGIGAMALGSFAIGAGRDRKAVWFWSAVACLAVLCAVGPFTPVYPLLKAAIPPLQVLRYPVKYTLFLALAVAWLGAIGCEALSRADGKPLARLLAAPAGLLLAVLAATSGAAVWALSSGGQDEAMSYLQHSILAGAPRLVAVAIVTGLLMWWIVSGRSASTYYRGALLAVVLADLLAANANLNPTLDARIFDTPEWVQATRDDPHGRTYIPGRESLGDPVATGGGTMVFPFDTSGLPREAALAMLEARRTCFPSPHGIREAISADPTGMWPASYNMFVGKFANADRGFQAYALSRFGVRYHCVPRPPAGAARKVADIPELGEYALYETPCLPRAYVAVNAIVVAERDQRLNTLFAPGFDAANVVALEGNPPAAAGVAGPPAAPAASLVSDGPNRVEVAASAGAEGGYLVLLDSWSPVWRVTVDGQPAHMLKASELFRAVRLTPGSHAVVFEYDPSAFVYGCIVSALTAMTLLGVAFVSRRSSQKRENDESDEVRSPDQP